jgi:tryptophan-rich sensory protein
MDKRKIWALAAVLLPLATIFCGAALSGANARTYGMLYRPSLAPEWAGFAAGWAVACLLTGVAGGFLIYGRRKTGTVLYVAIVILNFAWWILFFGFYTYFAALALMVLTIAAAAAFFIELSKTHLPAAFIFAPYVVWASYCAVLTFEFWLLNALF